MTECYSARCQQDRKLARREFQKWTKNVLLQVGFETLAKNHWDINVNRFSDDSEEEILMDFNPNETCLFCQNRKELFSNKNDQQQIVFHEDENLPLDLSLKSTSIKFVYPTKELTKKSFCFFRHPTMSDMIPPIKDFDRFMAEMIASQSYLNLFPTNSIPFSQDARIAQLAKQMAYERMLEEIQTQRHSSVNKKSLLSPFHPSILTESIHVNHLLNDVMVKILHEMFEKQQPRASHKGELLFVKKQNINNDEQYTKKTSQVRNNAFFLCD